MIEVKIWLDDIDGIRDFGILLLQNNIVYKLRKDGDFAIFSINNLYDKGVMVIKTGEALDDYNYSKFILKIGVDKNEIEFKAFALKIF
jgi:hypothetical protein